MKYFSYNEYSGKLPLFPYINQKGVDSAIMNLMGSLSSSAEIKSFRKILKKKDEEFKEQWKLKPKNHGKEKSQSSLAWRQVLKFSSYGKIISSFKVDIKTKKGKDIFYLQQIWR